MFKPSIIITLYLGPRHVMQAELILSAPSLASSLLLPAAQRGSLFLWMSFFQKEPDAIQYLVFARMVWLCWKSLSPAVLGAANVLAR